MDCCPLTPLSMGFSRQGYWSGLPFPPPGDLSDPGIKPRSPALQTDSLPLSHLGSPSIPLDHEFFFNVPGYVPVSPLNRIGILLLCENCVHFNGVELVYGVFRSALNTSLIA